MKYFLLVFVCFLLWCMCQCIRKPINLKLCLLEIVFYYFLTEVSDSTHKSVDVIESPDTKQSPTPAKLMQSIQCSGVLLPLPALYHQSLVSGQQYYIVCQISQYLLPEPEHQYFPHL